MTNLGIPNLRTGLSPSRTLPRSPRARLCDGTCECCGMPISGTGFVVREKGKKLRVCDGCEDWRRDCGQLPKPNDLQLDSRPVSPDSVVDPHESPQWLQR